jgi:small subunit ribosomal protein S13
MARIAGVDLPVQKRAEIGLTYIYGIGRARSNSILHRAGINPDTKVRDLNEDEVGRIRKILEEEGNIEGDLRKEISMNVRRLIEIGSYRGSRHRRNLPVHGQRTHTNARTRKGPRKGTVANKKKASAKT